MEKTEMLDLGRSVADGFGVAGSAACAVHCAVFPVLLVTGTALPTFFIGEAFHQAMLLMIVPAALLAFGLGCRRHKDRTVLLFGILGLAALLLSGIAPHEILGENGERAITLGAAACLTFAHVRNFKLCRADRCDQC